MEKYAWKATVIEGKLDEYMKDVMVMELDPVTGAQPLLKKVFSFK